jgi:hypothetical protein
VELPGGLRGGGGTFAREEEEEEEERRLEVEGRCQLLLRRRAVWWECRVMFCKWPMVYSALSQTWFSALPTVVRHLVADNQIVFAGHIELVNPTVSRNYGTCADQ